MATKSIVKNVTIKDKQAGRGMVLALENAQKVRSKDVVYSRKCVTLTGEDIKKVFGEGK